VNECLAAHGVSQPVLNLGLPDEFVEQGNHAQLLSLLGLDAAGIERSISAWLENPACHAAPNTIAF
jgi:1-deoxy-D-xylulose-5-phosphate synthase